METESANAVCPKCGASLVVVETSTLHIPVSSLGQIEVNGAIKITHWCMELRCMNGTYGDIDCDFHKSLPDGIRTDILKVLKETT